MIAPVLGPLLSNYFWFTIISNRFGLEKTGNSFVAFFWSIGNRLYYLICQLPPIQITRNAFHFNICFIHSPATAYCNFSILHLQFDKWCEFIHPTLYCRMVNHNATHLHYLFNIPITQSKSELKYTA